ncbi:ABC transporter ATP-binding protein [Pelagicoccus sp. SDUM812005]|uniref:ABC transporter ATP-binding protein n=1 Tax=Pelagicoccus sp. SDUM812005 TaxID=3041257 RepID=UPI00280F32E0|nr:ABC transporter ATP-binding protein [Pelagicoccus sp. SDUM812005]MDQ8179595.1 ABC transporter ATP-binding protein [Pelagicoccus sp. SDUM812005]
MALLEIEYLEKGYGAEGGARPVLSVDRFSLEAGEQVAVMGPSGCGKTTFLHLVAGIVPASRGRIQVGDTVVSELGEAARDRYRARTVGYVFQSFHLMRDFSCIENVELGMSFGAQVDRSFAKSLLMRVGLGDRLEYRASQLSVGQQQRVAVARALANRPKLVLADEPTGSLDEVASEQVVALLRELCEENGASLLLVSHDRSVVDGFSRREDFRSLNKALAGTEGGAR